ncbi:MAG: uracil-DNA glycosylase [Thermoanaerobaculales bacterium]|jgi:DNA polymerase|nr:uracil-DNA glycosylase [Thermoanaerobaculales bacterium]
MRPRDLSRYLDDLGWRDPLDLPEETTTATKDVQPPPSADGASSAAAAADVDELVRLLADCRLCRLSEKRSTVVVGEGGARSRVLFVGEGPGADEDRTGRPFVGQAGKILDKMILAMGLDRERVYITNVVKCRPPGNRDPKDDEIAACSPFLDRQIELIRPELIVALGRFAANRLTGTEKPLGALRGRWSRYKGVPLIATYHPAYLLRTPSDKRKVWDDLKLVLAKLAESRQSTVDS